MEWGLESHLGDGGAISRGGVAVRLEDVGDPKAGDVARADLRGALRAGEGAPGLGQRDRCKVGLDGNIDMRASPRLLLAHHLHFLVHLRLLDSPAQHG